MPAPRRIHFAGGPWSGKTTAARRVGATLGLPVFHLDYEWLDTAASAHLDDEATLAVMADRVEEYARGDAWMSEGAFIGWVTPLLQRADLIVWLQVSRPVAGYRVLRRHLQAELRGDNPFPGWRKFYRFWRWTDRFYTNTNPPGLNPWGTPNTLATLTTVLAAYGDKVVACRSVEDEALTGRLQEEPA